MRCIAGGIDGLEAVFDDVSLVGDAGLLLAGTVMGRLGLESLIDETVRLDGRVAGSGSGRKVLTLVASMLVGGCCIDDAGRLRAQRPPQTAPARELALGPHLHHSPGTHPQPAPAHLTRRPGPAQPTSTPAPPTRHRPQPRPNAPQNAPARPHTPASPNQPPNRHPHKPIGGSKLREREVSLSCCQAAWGRF